MLTEERKRRYEEVLALAQEELDQLDKELAAEIARSKERIRDLQEAKRSVKQIYDGAAARLGIKNDFEMRAIEVVEIEKHG
ncbi:MAG: hypothetical protein ABSH28_05030 [Acidobacteriota bacterium]|jgi:myo-inositol catabolism protein IolC